jgi:hypothetical protein
MNVQGRPRRHWRRGLAAGLATIWLGLALWHTHKPLPPGVHVAGAAVSVPAGAMRFIPDVTAMDADGRMIRNQPIHAATLQLVREARDFLLLDYFLFNDQGGPRGSLDYSNGLSPVSQELIAALRQLARAQPGLPILVLVDPINDYYRGTAPPALAALQELGVDVVVTQLDGLRDSNPVYSATWRMLFSWWAPTGGEGRLPNLLDGYGPGLRLGALLRLPNFKANHRKLALTGDGNGSLLGILASANPHDASSAHSNVALQIEGEALRPLLASELAIARFSGWPGGALESFAAARSAAPAHDAAAAGDTQVAIATEGAIRAALLKRFDATAQGDAIDIAQFYLAEGAVIEALVRAARRGVTIRVLLDPNRDAFGFEKSGIPNRPVGHALARDGDGAIALRWYRTHGEQFHAKLAAVHSGHSLWFTLGSANFTRRNLDDLNLEANAVVDTPTGSALAVEVMGWFEALWSNADGVEYTASGDSWPEDSAWRYWKSRFMEASGMSTF